MNRRTRLGLLAFAAVAAGVVVPAWADAGTPLMFAWGMHLFFGNAVIGIGEGLLIAWVFKTGRARAVILMILANYVSMITGQAIIFGFGQIPAVWHWLTIYTIPLALAGAAVAFYLLTILIEWPFCFFAFAKGRRTAKRAVGASLLAQTVSYAILAFIYLKASYLSLYTNGDADPSLVAETRNNATVYFISPEEDAVCSVRIDGTGRAEVAALPEGVRGLEVRESEDGSTCSLVGLGQEDDEVLLVKNLCPRGRVAKHPESTTGLMGVGAVGAKEDGDAWEVFAGFWPAQGILVRNLRTNESYDLAMEAPFVMFASRNPSLLPDDRAVYQLGDQTLLLDLPARRLGLIARGWSPLVVMDEQGDGAAGVDAVVKTE